jgi:hypothetical protein
MKRAVFLALLLLNCASARPGGIVDAALLKGAWTSGGPSFDFDIGERTILFEFDMKEHPYVTEGNTVVIDFQDPTLGVQRKRVIRLTADVLEWEDEQFGVRGVYRRMR